MRCVPNCIVLAVEAAAAVVVVEAAVEAVVVSFRKLWSLLVNANWQCMFFLTTLPKLKLTHLPLPLISGLDLFQDVKPGTPAFHKSIGFICIFLAKKTIEVKISAPHNQYTVLKCTNRSMQFKMQLKSVFICLRRDNKWVN